MRVNNEDKTIKRNYVQKYHFVINEYKVVKEKNIYHYRHTGLDPVSIFQNPYGFLLPQE